MGDLWELQSLESISTDGDVAFGGPGSGLQSLQPDLCLDSIPSVGVGSKSSDSAGYISLEVHESRMYSLIQAQDNANAIRDQEMMSFKKKCLEDVLKSKNELEELESLFERRLQAKTEERVLELWNEDVDRRNLNINFESVVKVSLN